MKRRTTDAAGGDEKAARAEATWSAESQKRSFKFLLAYVGVQIMYLAGYFLAAVYNKLNYVPLAADCLMLTMHVGILSLKLCEDRRAMRGRPQLCLSKLITALLSITQVMDAALFALADQVVEAEANKVLHIGALFDPLGGIPSLDGRSLPHPYKSNCVFQFHCLYMSIFVLPFVQAVIIMPICAVVYGTIVVAAYSNYYKDREEGASSNSDYEDLVLEIAMVVLTVLFAVLVKKMLEVTQRPLVIELALNKEEAIREKVKRCQVEFRFAGLQDKIKTFKSGKIFDLASAGSLRDGDGELRGPAAPPQPPSLASAKSAPPMILSRGIRPAAEGSPGSLKVVEECCEENGDCLPSTACVWVEHQALPQPLAAVQSGQRVLCYDNLLRGLKYSSVLHKETVEAATPPDWVTVCLADGSKLNMTADHPVECYQHEPGSPSTPASASRECLKAVDLKAGRDSLMVLKTSPVAVADVQRPRQPEPAHETCPSLSRSRVALHVQQPDRHTIFVASHPDAQQQGMAVGSADLLPAGNMLSVKRTFLDVISLNSGNSRKTVSAPPAVQGAVLGANEVAGVPVLGHGIVEEFVESDLLSWTAEEAQADQRSPSGGVVGIFQSIRQRLPTSGKHSPPSVAGSTAPGSSSNGDDNARELAADRPKLHGGRRRERQRARRQLPPKKVHEGAGKTQEETDASTFI